MKKKQEIVLTEKDEQKLVYLKTDDGSSIIGRILYVDEECEYFDIDPYKSSYINNETILFRDVLYLTFLNKTQYNKVIKSFPKLKEFLSYNLSIDNGKLVFGCGAVEVTEKELNGFIKYYETRRKLEETIKKLDNTMKTLLNEINNQEGIAPDQITDNLDIKQIYQLKDWFKFDLEKSVKQIVTK